MSPFGIILAVADEIPRRAAALSAASPADLGLIAGRLDEAARKVRVIALCREAEAPCTVARFPARQLRGAA